VESLTTIKVSKTVDKRSSSFGKVAVGGTIVGGMTVGVGDGVHDRLVNMAKMHINSKNRLKDMRQQVFSMGALLAFYFLIKIGKGIIWFTG
jgi:hypothetical protein